MNEHIKYPKYVKVHIHIFILLLLGLITFGLLFYVTNDALNSSYKQIEQRDNMIRRLLLDDMKKEFR